MKKLINGTSIFVYVDFYVITYIFYVGLEGYSPIESDKVRD